LLAQIIVAVAAVFVALNADARVARSVSESKAPAEDASYQQLIDAANAVVGVHVTALPNARSNDTLGNDRTGSGVLIGNDGLVLTIGYLILEADQVEVTDADGTQVPATVVAYDHASGFGLVRPIVRLAQKSIRLGTAQPISQLDRLMIVTGGGEQTISIATVVSRRQFAGYWEYMIDGAIFTAPPRLDHSGAALINKDGELVGIGSLFVMDALVPGERLPGNMFVPVDLLKPALEEMIATGAQRASRRPWLGLNSLEEDGRIKVMQVNEESPAQRAGIVAGDIILSINGEPVESLEKFYHNLWTRGPAGVDVVLTVLHGPKMKEITVRSIDRQEFMRRKPGI
jgi:S1-C subfamily serine protease